jgi:ParB/RepB/Spo0J family partition protein
MTTTETTTKKARKAATPAVDAVDTFPFEMLEATKSADNVDPNTLIFPNFDSRADSENLKLEPSFADDVKVNGILQPPLVTPVRDRNTGKTGLLIVAGRQRVRAAIAAGNDKNRVIPVHIKTLTLLEAIIACGVENIKRRSLSFWDEANYMRMLRDDYGLKQTEIKEKLGVADSKVSQYLSVFDCDDRVQKMVRKGQLEPGTGTKIRALKAVKDGDQQYAIAVKAIEKGWTADDIDEAAKRLEAKLEAAAQAAKERAAAKKAKKGEGEEAEAEAEVEAEAEEKYAIDSIAVVKAAELRALLNSIDAKITRMRAKDSVDEAKLAYERGKLDGLKLASGLKALPKSIVADEEAEG